MKKTILLALAMFFAIAGQAFAKDGYSVRYTTTYERWDRGFSTHYSYSETSYSSYSDCYGYRTCYTGFSSTSTVYVEETVVTSGQYRGYTRINVYENNRYGGSNDYYRRHGRFEYEPYATYYTHNGRVVRRTYRSHRHYHNHYYYNTYYSTYNYVVLDKFTAQLILGAKFIELGAHVIAACDENSDSYELCMLLGLASSVSGSLISISASLEQQQETELMRELERQKKEKQKRDLDDALDE